jgi:hypothetical protein
VDLVSAALGALDNKIVGLSEDWIVGCAIVGSMVGFAIICLILGSVIVGFANIHFILGSAIVGFAIICLIVGTVNVGSIVGSAISTLELSLLLFFPFSVVDKSAVAGTMIVMPLICFPVRVQEDGEVMEHFPS